MASHEQLMIKIEMNIKEDPEPPWRMQQEEYSALNVPAKRTQGKNGDQPPPGPDPVATEGAVDAASIKEEPTPECPQGSVAFTPGSKERKRATALPQLSKEQEEMLAEWYRDHDLFYNQSVRDFKDKGKRDKMLESKAKQLGMTGKELAIWFSNMRTMFGKLKKSQSGSGSPRLTARQLWVLQAFSFLDPHLVLKTGQRQLGKFPPYSQSVSATERDEDKLEDGEDGDQTLQRQQPLHSRDEGYPPGSGSAGTQDGPPQGRRCQKRKLCESGSNMQERMTGVQGPEQHWEEAVCCNTSPRTSWAHWLASELSVMSEANWLQFQRQSFQWIMSLKGQQASSESMPPIPPSESPHSHSGSSSTDMMATTAAAATAVASLAT